MFKNDEEMLDAFQRKFIECGEAFLRVIPENEPLALDGAREMIEKRLQQVKGDEE